MVEIAGAHEAGFVDRRGSPSLGTLSSSEGAQPPLRPLHLVGRETEFCGQRLAGDFRRRMRENGRNSVRRPQIASLTDRNQDRAGHRTAAARRWRELSPSLSPPPAGCRTRCGPRSLACASAATPSGSIGPTRREDRSIGSRRQNWANMAPHSTLRRRPLAKRHRIDRSAPRGSDPVGRRDGKRRKASRAGEAIGPANAIGV